MKKNIMQMYADEIAGYLKRIAELEEKLKNAIVPKFKIGQTSYYIFDDVVGFFKPEKVCEVRDVLILGIQIYEQGTQYQTTYGLFNEDTLFATKEEAQAKLEELKGENKFLKKELYGKK